MLRLFASQVRPRAATVLRPSHRLLAGQANGLETEPTFNQCVELYFDEAASHTKWSADILRELKEVNCVLSFKFSIEDEKDITKVHTINAYRAQHSHHRLPWFVCRSPPVCSLKYEKDGYWGTWMGAAEAALG